MSDSYKPTEGMIEEAKRGLEWRSEFGRGGTEVGIARARDISNGKNLPLDTVKRMYSFFSRHEVNKEAEGFRPGEEGYPSNGRIAWALWGGNPGFAWSRQIVEREAERAAEITDAIRTGLQNKADEHNEEYGDTKTKRVTLGMLTQVFRRGVGAYETNPESVRPNVKSPEQWAYARVDSFLYAVRNEKFRSGKHDTDLFPEGHPLRSEERSMDARPYPNEHAARIHDPDDYERFARQKDKGAIGVDFIYGIKGQESDIQSIRFDADRYTADEARAWLEDRKFNVLKFEEATMEERHIKSIEENDDEIIVTFTKEDEVVVERDIPELKHRAMDMEQKVVDEESRRVRLSLSSERAVERGYGQEVLGHNDGEIDMEFATSGRMPLLLDHDMTKQVGVVEKVELETGRRLRAVVRFGRGELASEVFNDVVDGIRGNISVGYEVKKMVKDEREDGTVYRATSWRPMEVSIVSVPADPDVGIGRSNQVKSEPHASLKEDKMSVEANAVDYRKEVGEINALGAKHNKRDLADKAILEGKSLAEFRGMLLDEIASAPISLEDIGATKQEQRSYSLVRAIRSAASGRFDGFEREVSEELASRYGKDPRGFFVPSDIFKRDVTTAAPVGGPGSNLVPTDHLGSQFIDALRENLVISRLGARMMQGLEGNVAIPKLTARTAVTFVAENNAPGSEGAPEFGQVTMSPKGMVQFVDISRRLMMQSDPSVEAVIRDDMVRQFAAKIDQVAIQGGGANEPTGILETSGIAEIYTDASGDAGDGGDLAYTHMVELEKEVAIDNALNGNLFFLTNPKVVAQMRQTPRQASGVEGNFILNDTNEVLGYSVEKTNLVPSDLTTTGGGSALSALIFGNFGDLMIGMFGGLDVLVDPYTGSGTGATRVAMYQDIDVAVRHAESFAAVIDIDA